MTYKRLAILLLLIGALVLAACSGAATPAAETNDNNTQTTADTTTTDENSDQTATEPEETTTTSEETGDTALTYNGPDWTHIELTDVRTGQTFTFADFAGKTVYVHAMANWCSNCRSAQRTLRDMVIPQVNTDEVVFVSLNIEPTSGDDALHDYVLENSFDWTFAVANTTLWQALVQQFGRAVSNPPSTPHFIIAPDGTPSQLITGTQTPTEIISLINEFGGS
ncbi:MAG: hypothetical protein D6712_16325 [Chloroflexi bacterium]|nr:MAG: hypothetical protein D6712_16325 [Chloroflexota bacterium]